MKSKPAPKRFVIYLPKSAETKGIVSTVELLLCRRFGGLTTYPAVGMFEGKSKDIQREEVQVIECYGELETWEKDGPMVYGLASLLALLLSQESIGCSVEGRLYLVEAAQHSGDGTLDGGDIINSDELERVATMMADKLECPW
jgi:hypothetical protein